MNLIRDEFVVMPNHFHAIIRGFKSAVTTQARLMTIDFKWQRGFHDHIIRDDKVHQKIAEYIINNSKRWTEDLFYK